MCTRIIKFFTNIAVLILVCTPITKVFADTVADLKNTYNGIESSLKSSYKSTQQSVSLEQASLPTFFKIANTSNPSQADIDAAKKELSDWNSKIPTGVIVEWGKVSTTQSGFQRIDNADGIEGKTVITEPNGTQHVSNLLNGEQETIYDSTGKDITADYATIQKLSGGNVASVLTYPDANGNFQLFPEKTTTSDSTATDSTTKVCNNNTCTYQMLAPIPGFLGNSSGKYVITQDSKSLCALLNQWFRIGIALAGMLAVVMIVLGGFQYATTDSLFDKSDGKGKIQNALWGLGLALTTWLVLSTVNPELTKCELKATATQLTAVPVSSGGNSSGNPLVSTTNTSSAFTGLADSSGAAAILKKAQDSIGTTQYCYGADANVRCADAVNKIVLDATGEVVGGDVSTSRMKTALDRSSNWTVVPGGLTDSQPGDIIISPTVGETHGHVGIVATAGATSIISNSSKTGTVEARQTGTGWQNYYEGNKGLNTYIYRNTIPQK